jgi:hypothetical protein
MIAITLLISFPDKVCAVGDVDERIGLLPVVVVVVAEVGVVRYCASFLGAVAEVEPVFLAHGYEKGCDSGCRSCEA